jgi:hypothetical protein
VSVLETDAKQPGRGPGRRFVKGESGNPAGRPNGARNHATRVAEDLLEGEAEAITRRAIELAKEGDTTALRLCLERIMPVRRDRATPFALPELRTAGDAVKASAALLKAVANGELSTDQAAALGKLIESYVKAIEVSELEARIEALERTSPRGPR